jgi:very-short-patch-repair endonuclease
MNWDPLAVAQAGVISRTQLRSHGADDREISRLVDRGQLKRLAEGIFLARGAPLTRAAQVWAAVLATGGVVGFESAGHLWSQLDDPPPKVHICVDHDLRSHAPEWVTTHRVLLPAWACTRRGELPVTTRSWTLLDLIGAARRDSDGSRLLDRGLQQGWLRADDIDRRLIASPRRPGNSRLRRLRDQLGDGAAAQSERVLHAILRRGGLTGWKPNYRVLLVDGAAIVVDVAFVERKLAIEVDGWAFHSDVDRFRRDRHRQNTLVALGWTVVRFTWADLTERPDYVLSTILDLGAQMDTG